MLLRNRFPSHPIYGFDDQTISNMENEAGIKYHVDHIIPLAIGGAHHQDNLRIIPSKDNISKGKKYDPTLGGKWANNNKARYTKKKLGIR